MKRIISLSALRAVEAFGRLGSVTAAASELGVTSGAVSQQIRRAEEELGTSLLARKGRYISLTEPAQAFHEKISAAFNELKIAQDEFLRQNSKTRIVLGTHPSIASRWIAPLLFEWQKEYPDAMVHLVEFKSGASERNKEVDFRIIYGNKTELGKSLPLFNDWVIPVCSPGLCKRNQLTEPRDVLAQPLLWIEWEQEFERPPDWDDWARHVGAQMPVSTGKLRFSISSIAIEAAIEGRGFVLAQLSMVWDDIKAGRLVAPFNRPLPLPQPYILAWDDAILKKPFAGAMHHWLVEMGREQTMRRDLLPSLPLLSLRT